MPEVNQTTVRREKKRDKGTLQPGIPPPPQEAVTEQPLPEAVPLPSKLPQVAFPFPFTFVLPENTAGARHVQLLDSHIWFPYSPNQ